MSIYTNEISSIFLAALKEAEGDDTNGETITDSDSTNTGDNVDEQQPQPEDNEDNIDDNSEEQQDSDTMDENNSIDNGNENFEDDPNDDTMNDESNSDDQPSTEIMSDPESNLNLQKYQLFKNYELVYNTTENLLDNLSDYSTSDLDDKQYKLYIHLLNSLKEIKSNLSYTMNDTFKQMEYEKLLKVFIYIKGSLKVITELLKNIFSCENN